LMDHSRNVLMRGSSFRSDALAAIVGTDEVKSEDRTCCDSMRFRLEVPPVRWDGASAQGFGARITPNGGRSSD
jgi:hypothetical protein